MKSIDETMQELAAAMAFLEPMQRIEYLIDLSKKAEGLPEDLRTDEHKVYGCASDTWLIVQEEDGHVTIATDSEAAIVKGLLQLLQKCFNGHSKEEIVAVDGQRVLDTIGLGGSLSNRRMNGFASAIEMIQRQLREKIELGQNGQTKP